MNKKDEAMTMSKRVDRKVRTHGVDRLTAAIMVRDEMDELRRKGLNPHCSRDPEEAHEKFRMILTAHDHLHEDFYQARVAELDERRANRIRIFVTFMIGLFISALMISGGWVLVMNE